jgi:hypothetical protein
MTPRRLFAAAVAAALLTLATVAWLTSALKEMP